MLGYWFEGGRSEMLTGFKQSLYQLLHVEILIWEPFSDLRMSPFSCCSDERQIFRINDFNCGLQGYVQWIEFIIQLLNINIRNPDLNL